MLSQKIVSIYKDIYDLPELTYEEYVPKEYFQLYNKKHYFVTIAVYNTQKEFLVVRDFNKNIGWELPGGYITDNENIEDTVNRIVWSEAGIEIDELEPVSIVKNIFKCGDKTVVHTGVAFMALSRSTIKNNLVNIQTLFTKKIPEKIAFQNDKILHLVRRRLEAKNHLPPFGEIESIKNKKFILLYLLHKYIVKPIGRLSSIKIRNHVFGLIKNTPKTILDASCGDSSIINDLCRRFKPDICIGNDISWKTISLIKNKEPSVIFTNHNVLDLPYKFKFDLVIFKNTLHHIEKQHQVKVLRQLKNLSKQLIIVDINDPQNTSFLSKMWNNYYVYLLGDQGESFLNYETFKNIVEDECKDQNYNLGKIDTIKGQYFSASINETK